MSLRCAEGVPACLYDVRKVCRHVFKMCGRCAGMSLQCAEGVPACLYTVQLGCFILSDTAD